MHFPKAVDGTEAVFTHHESLNFGGSFAREPKRIALWEIDLSRVCLFRLSVNPFAQLTRLFPHSISISDAFICGTNFTDKNLFANFVLSNFKHL